MALHNAEEDRIRICAMRKLFCFFGFHNWRRLIFERGDICSDCNAMK